MHLVLDSFFSIYIDILFFFIVGTPTQVQAYIPSEIDMEITVEAKKVELVVMEGQIDPAANSLFLSVCIVSKQNGSIW